jgi:hypothetical protein
MNLRSLLSGKSSDSKDEKLDNIGDQTQEEIELAAHVRNKVEDQRSKASRIANEGIWMTNIAYICGMDGLTFNTTSRSFQPVNRGAAYLKKSRIHVNKILPTIQNRTARLCKNPPRYDVRPENMDADSKDAARFALKVLNAKWEELKINQKRIPMMMWMQECGHAYIKIVWDDTLGEPITDPMTGEVSYPGDIRCEVVPAFEVFPDPMAKSLDEAQYVIHAKVRPLEYFKTHYPKRGHLVKEEVAWLLSAQYEARVNSMNSRGPSQGGMTDIMKNSALELIKYEKRSSKYPNGRMIVTASGVLLENKDLPIGEIPFAKFDDMVIGGKYYPEACITHLRPIQDQYNEVIRRRAEWTRLLLAGKYAAPKGGGLQQESMNDQNGEVVYFTPMPAAPNGGMPMALQVPAIPQYAYKEEQALDDMFNKIAGISDASQGEIPSASIPAAGLAILIESDQTRIGIMTEQHELAWADVGRFILKYVDKFYIMPRKLKMSGQNMEYAVKDFTGEDLKGHTDVMVVRGSTLPDSKVVNRTDINNAYQSGLLGDPADPKVREKVLSMMEFGDVGEAWHRQALVSGQIKRGMEKITKGIPIPISEFDNHPEWLIALDDFRLTSDFEEASPEIQQTVLNAMEAHLGHTVALSNAAPKEDPSLHVPPPPTLPEPAPVGAAPQGPPPASPI